MSAWPEAFDDLLAELRAHRASLVLADGAGLRDAPATEALAERVERVSLGMTLAGMAAPPSPAELAAAVSRDGPSLLVDIDAMFTPALAIEVLPFLRGLGRRQPTIVLWPGNISATRLTYSRPGAVDHFDEAARDLIVLRPVEARFPDEVPYLLERFPN